MKPQNPQPNEAAAVDSPIVPLSAFGCQLRRATEQRRSAIL